MLIFFDCQDPAVSTVPFILEAERNRDLPFWNFPEEWHTIVSSTAPRVGSWNSATGSGGSFNPTPQQNFRSQSVQETDLQVQRSESLGRTSIFFKKPLIVAEAEKFVLRHQINPLAVNYSAVDNSFSGGFDYSKGLTYSLQWGIEKMESDLSYLEECIANNSKECGVSKGLRTILQRKIDTLKNESIKISALVVEGAQEVLHGKLQHDSNVSFESPRKFGNNR